MGYKVRMRENWQEEGEKGPKKGEVLELDFSNAVYGDDGEIEYWFVPYGGEFYEIYPYELEVL